MGEQPTPIWHPISKLPLIAGMVVEILQGARVQLQNLQAARHRPYVLDDALVMRIVSSYSEQAEMIPVYREQVVRWQKLNLSAEQAREVRRLAGHLESLRDVLHAIITLAEAESLSVGVSRYESDIEAEPFVRLFGKLGAYKRKDPQQV